MGHHAQSFLQSVLPVLLVLLLADDFGVTTNHPSFCTFTCRCWFVSAWTTRSATTTIASHVHRINKLSSLSKRRVIRRITPPLQDEQRFYAIGSNDGSSLDRDASDAILDNNNNNNNNDDDNSIDNNLPFVVSPIPLSKTGNDSMQQETDDVAALNYILDPDLYTQSRKLLNADGSLRLESLSSRDARRIVGEGHDVDQSPSPQTSFDVYDTDGFDDGDGEWSNPEDDFLQSTMVGTIPSSDIAYRQMVESLFLPQQGQRNDDNNSDNNDATMDDLWEAIRKQRQAMEAAASVSGPIHASSKRQKKAATVGSNGSNADNSIDDDPKAVDDDDNHSTTEGSDPVHDEIFAQEDGFFLQSRTFRESLIGNDREKAAKARSLRTGKSFRQRQEAAIQSLQEQMDDFEQNILPQLGSSSSSSAASSSFYSRQQVVASSFNKTAATTNAVVSNIPMVRCSECGCILAKDEIDHWIRQRRRFQQQQQQQQQQQGQPSTGNSGIDEIQRICRACHCDALVSQSNKRLARGGNRYSTQNKINRDGRRNYGYPSSKMATPTTPSMLQSALWRRQAQQKQQQISSPSFRPSPTEQWRRNEPKTKVQQQEPKESQTLLSRAVPMKDDWDKNGEDEGKKL